MKIILFVILFLAVFSGMFTMKNAPWIYVGKVPYLSYESPTPSETLMTKKLLELTSINGMEHLKIYQGFDPNIYVIELIEWKLINLNNTSSFNIQVQYLTNTINTTNENIIFNSAQLIATQK
jgi:hypothetical protein